MLDRKKRGEMNEGEGEEKEEEGEKGGESVIGFQ